MEWKLTDGRPIWQQLTEQITLRILKGEYPPGDGCRRCGTWRSRRG